MGTKCVGYFIFIKYVLCGVVGVSKGMNVVSCFFVCLFVNVSV